MTFYTIIVILQALGALFGLITIVVSYLQPASFNQKLITVTATCSFIGLLAYLFEILATSLEEALLAARFGYIGKCYAMVLFLIFIARYCNVSLPKWIVNFLMVFCTGILILVLTCPYHSLYYTSIAFDGGGLFPHLVLGKGFIYYLYMVVILLVILVFMCISITTLIKRKGKERSRLTLLCLSGFIPAIALVLNLLPFMQGFDPTPLGIMVSCCLVTYNVLKYGLLDTMQLAGANALDDANYGVVVVDKEFVFLYANNRGFEVFPDLKDTEKMNHTLDEIFAGCKEDKLRSIINKDDKILELNYSVLGEDNKKSKKSINGYMAWVFDMTEEYNYTKELEKLRIEAEEANRSKSIFLAKMSHEIRTPMNGILGFAGLALERKQDAETEEYLKYIKNSADSLLGIINDVLDISKIESGKMEIIDVEYNPVKFFDDISALIKTQISEKGIQYESIVPKDLPRYLYGDSIRFREVLVNILGNAVKYTKEGSVTLDVAIKEWGEDDLTFEIHVRDTGVGIKPEMIDDIFNIFEQGDNLSNYYVEGTGLGLSIAKQLVELMNGSITVDSEYGVGSDFCIIIPQKYVASVKKNDNQIEDVVEDIELNTKGIRALIVDDNVINLKVEKGILEKYNISVDICESGKECLSKVDKVKYDVILMDHMMPDMDGVETMQAIRKGKNPNVTTPMLLVTANAIVGIKQEMLSIGFEGFISKPIDIKALQLELARVLPDEKMTIQEEIVVEDSQDDVTEELELLKTLEKWGIDVEAGIKYCGDIDVYREVLMIATTGAKEKTAQIREFVEKQDMDNYRIMIHSIKSSVANIGATDLSRFAKDLEYAVKDKDYEFVNDYTSDFLTSYEKLMQDITKILCKTDSQKEVLASSKSLTREEWDADLEKLSYYLDELESDLAVDLVNNLLMCNVNDEVRNILQGIKSSLEKFDIEEAKSGVAVLYNLVEML